MNADGQQGEHTGETWWIHRQTNNYNDRGHDLNTLRESQGDYTQVGDTAGSHKRDERKN